MTKKAKKKKGNVPGVLLGAGILGIGAYLLLKKGKGMIKVKNIDPVTTTITLLNGKKEKVEEPIEFTSTVETPFLDFEVKLDAYFIKAEAVGYVTQEFGPIKIEKAGIIRELEIDLIQEGEGTLLSGNFVIFDASKTTEDLVSDVKLIIDGNQYPIQDQTYNGEQVVLTQGTHNINVEKEGYTLPGGATDIDFQDNGFIASVGLLPEGTTIPDGEPNGTIIEENVLYNLHADNEIRIQIPVKKTGTKKGEYRVYLLDENQQEIYELGLPNPIPPDFEGALSGPYETFLGLIQKYNWKEINPNETKWIIIDTGDSMFIDQPNEVGTQFYLKLVEKTKGEKQVVGPILIEEEEPKGSITNVQYTVIPDWLGDDEIDIEVDIENIDTIKRNYIVAVSKTADCSFDNIVVPYPLSCQLELAPSVFGVSVNPGQTWNTTLTSNWDNSWSIVDIVDGFYVQLFDKDSGTLVDVKGPFFVEEGPVECSPEGTNLFLMDPVVSAQQVFPTSIVSFELDVLNNGAVASDIKIELSRNGSFRKQTTTSLSQGQTKNIVFVDGMFEFNTAYNYTAKAFLITDDGQEIPCGNILNFPAISCGIPSGEPCTPSGLYPKMVDVGYSPSNPIAGDMVFLEADVQNTGLVSGDIVVDLYDETVPNSQPLKSYSLPNIPAGTGMSLAPYTFIAEGGKTYEFTYIATAIDEQGVYHDCTGPVSTGEFTVGGTPECEYPLSVSITDIDPNSPNVGDTIDVEYEINTTFNPGCSSDLVAKLYVDGQQKDSQTFNNVSGASIKNGEMSFSTEIAGNYNVKVKVTVEETGHTVKDSQYVQVEDDLCVVFLKITDLYYVSGPTPPNNQVYFRYAYCNYSNCPVGFKIQVLLDGQIQHNLNRSLASNTCSPVGDNLMGVSPVGSGQHTISVRLIFEGEIMDEESLTINA